eukprot:2335457-Rhodomonas_salina.1
MLSPPARQLRAPSLGRGSGSSKSSSKQCDHLTPRRACPRKDHVTVAWASWHCSTGKSSSTGPGPKFDDAGPTISGPSWLPVQGLFKLPGPASPASDLPGYHY